VNPDWSQHEQAALLSFLASPGPLKSALEKFLIDWAEREQAQCAAAMATVPRNPELASDHAAKAQALQEFWSVLTDLMTIFEVPSGEPTP